MDDELPELTFNESTPINFDSKISNLKVSLNSVKSNGSFLDDLKQRNKELNNLISNYQKKSEYLNSSINNVFDQTPSPVSLFSKTTPSKQLFDESYILDLKDREEKVNSDFISLEEKKLLLDTKERILSQGISSEANPQVLNVIRLIDSKMSALEQEKYLLKNQELLLKEDKKRISDLELNLLSAQKISQNKKRQLEQDCLILDSDISNKKITLQSLEQKQLDLDLLIKERTQLVQDLDKQYYASKSELESIKLKNSSESKFLERIKSDLENQQQKLKSDIALFEEQKIMFNEKMRLANDRSKSELDSYKKQVLDSLTEKNSAVDEKAKELNLREKMLLKFESELKRRENELSASLNRLSEDSSELYKKDELINQKLSLAKQKETEVKAYEDEVSNLEQTVFELKAIIEQKNKDLLDKESRLNNYSLELNALKKSLLFEKDFSPLVQDIKQKLKSNDVFEAQSLYSKLNSLFRSAPKSFQEDNFIILKELHSLISNQLKKAVLTKK